MLLGRLRSWWRCSMPPDADAYGAGADAHLP